MADEDNRPDTDEDMGNSADEKPQPRRRRPNPAPFSAKMVPHGSNSAERAKSAAPFREKTGNERIRNKSLPRSTGLPKVSLFRADGFYGTSSLFEAQSGSEFSGAEQSGEYSYGGEGSPGGLLFDEVDANVDGTAERFNSFKMPFWRNYKYGSGDHDAGVGSGECASADTAGASRRSAAETEEASNFSAPMDGVSSSPCVDAPSTSTPRATTSKSPPCKIRRLRTIDPRKTSLDSGFENSTASDFQSNVLDYELEEDFTSDSVGREGTVSVYEVVSTDSSEIVRVESGCTSRSFAFGSPIGDRETSETFGSSGKPATNVWQKTPVLVLNSDMSVDSAYEYNLPLPKQADEQPDADSASMNEMTPDESDFPIASTPESELEEFEGNERSASTTTDSGRSVIVDGPTAVESDSYISEMENCILFDTGTDDWFDEGASINLASPSSVSLFVRNLDSEEKRDGTPSGGSDRTSSDRVFTSTPEASNATEQRSAQRWPADH